MSVDSKPSDMYHARLVSMTFMAYNATTGFRIPDTDSGACTHSQTCALEVISTIEYIVYRLGMVLAWQANFDFTFKATIKHN